jgi:hypothetical protein
LLAALAASHAALAQPALGPSASEAQRQVVEQLERIQSRDGPNAEALIAPLTELAQLYEQDGDYGFAIATIDRAVGVIRVNRGVHSLDQAPLLRQALHDEEARGNSAEALNREQDLLALARRHPSDLRTVPIFREAADRRMAMMEREKTEEDPEDLCEALGIEVLICDTRAAAGAALREARPLYAEAIEVLLRNRLYSSDELRGLELALVRSVMERFATEDLPTVTAADRRGESRLILSAEHCKSGEPALLSGQDPTKLWVITERLDALYSRGTNDDSVKETDQPEELPTLALHAITLYEFGRRALSRLYYYEVVSAASSLAQIEAFVQVADWDLLHSCNSLALREYDQAYAWLRETGSAQAMDALFSPKTPVVLPAYAPNPLAQNALPYSTAYVDVAFTITPLGESRGIETRKTTTSGADAETESLVTLIKRSRFRPRVVDGVLGRAAPVVMRHYLGGRESEDTADGAE